MPQPASPPDRPIVLPNQRAIPLSGCLFYTIALLPAAVCLLNPIVGAVGFVLAYFLLSARWTSRYHLLIQSVRLLDHLYFHPGAVAWPVGAVDRLVVRPDPLEDYADSSRPLYELVFVARTAERYPLTVTADDARRAMDWCRARRIVVENQCDEGP
jgi:hypothetical protein